MASLELAQTAVTRSIFSFVISRQSSPRFADAPSHAHVTSRRSTHPRFTPTSPILTRPHQPSCAHSIASPLLTRLTWVYSSPVGRLSRASTPGEKDSEEPERAPSAIRRRQIPSKCGHCVVCWSRPYCLVQDQLLSKWLCTSPALGRMC